MSQVGSIPASQVVNVIPSVLSAGGAALDVIGLALTTSTRPPIGQILSFPTLASVQAYFGSGSDEAAFASTYFLGYDGRTITPDALLIAQYNTTDVAGYVRGGAGLTLDQVKAITSGTMTVVVAGTSKTSSTLNLSAATSLSNAASLITAAFTTPNFAVTYDSQSQAFVITSSATGATQTVVYPTGAAATSLLFTQALGAVLSQGTNAQTDPGAFMDGIVAITQNWVTFGTIFDPDGSGFANKQAFADWCNDQGDQFAYICWDTDSSPGTVVPATGSLGYALAQADVSGTCLISAPDYNVVAFVMGAAASVNYTRTNGRITFMFRKQSGLAPTVTSATIAENLKANGYNYYGGYATRAQDFNFLANGVVSGKFLWLDTYINQIQLNAALQQAILSGLTNVGSVPYNSRGYAMTEAFCLDPINAALNFGSIRPGVTLSAAQIAAVNDAAGADIAPTLRTRGWYLQVKDATPQVRANRGSPPCTLWYMDGGAVQHIDLASIEVQ